MTQSVPTTKLIENKFREDRLLHNMERISKLNLLYIGFIGWILVSNSISVIYLGNEIPYFELFTLLYSGFFIFNVSSFIFIQFFWLRGKRIGSITTQENFIYLSVIITIFWGTSVSIVDQQISMHLIIFTFCLVFYGAMIYLPTTFIVSLTVLTSLLLIFGIQVVQTDSGVAGLLILFVITIDIVAISLSRSMYKAYRNTYMANEKLKQEYEKSKALSERFEREANYDFLTQMNNRRGFKKYIENILAKDPVPQRLTLFVIDLDFFKQYNDLYGHTEGDMVLYKVAKKINHHANEHGYITARWGGEEFIAVKHWAADADPGEINLFNTLSLEIEKLRLPHAGSKVSEYVTVSVGGATAYCSSYGEVEELFDCADEVLYQVKEQGRNKLVHITL